MKGHGFKSCVTLEVSAAKFQGLGPDEFLAAIQRALTVFRDDKESWHTLIHNGMTADHSWTQPA